MHAALAYYYANRRETDLEIEELDREADKLEAESPVKGEPQLWNRVEFLSNWKVQVLCS